MIECKFRGGCNAASISTSIKANRETRNAARLLPLPPPSPLPPPRLKAHLMRGRREITGAPHNALTSERASVCGEAPSIRRFGKLRRERSGDETYGRRGISFRVDFPNQPPRCAGTVPETVPRRNPRRRSRPRKKTPATSILLSTGLRCPA